MKKRKLFCKISPLTYEISLIKCRLIRKLKNSKQNKVFVSEKSLDKLEYKIYKHNSLIRRKLGNVDLELQENKAVNLAIAAPLINNIVIKPGEIFSFWNLVGKCTKSKGYKEGLTIGNDQATRGIGEGLC